MSKPKLKQAATDSLSRSLKNKREKNEQRAKQLFTFKNLIRQLHEVVETFPTVLELFDENYKLLRSKLATRKALFQDIRAITKFLCFDDWEYMIEWMIQGFKKRHKPPGWDTS